LIDDEKDGFDSMRVNSESVSNEIDESDLQDESILNSGFQYGEE
jgi:hypothetical protein